MGKRFNFRVIVDDVFKEIKKNLARVKLIKLMTFL